MENINRWRPHYSVLTHPVLGYKVIRMDGAGFWAFIFGAFWLMYNKLWLKGLLFMALFVLNPVALEALGITAGKYLPSLLLLFIIMFKGGKWKEQQFIKNRGYKKLGQINAMSADDALSKIVTEEKKG